MEKRMANSSGGIVFTFSLSIKRIGLKIMRTGLTTWELLCNIAPKLTLTPNFKQH